MNTNTGDATLDLVKTCSPQKLAKVLQSADGVQVVDVRETFEFAGKHLADSVNIPLSGLAEDLDQVPCEGDVYVVCQSGARARKAVESLQTKGHSRLILVEGGMNAWLAAGLPVEDGGSRIWSIERQVRVAAGAMVFTGSLLAFFVNIHFVFLVMFVGAGLVFAGVTNTCGMGLMLAKMPWNKGGGQELRAGCPIPVKK